MVENTLLTFIDDHARYIWIYVLKHKDEVFPCFLGWKAQQWKVERSTGRKLKTLRTDNGCEYVLADFEKCLKKEGKEDIFSSLDRKETKCETP